MNRRDALRIIAALAGTGLSCAAGADARPGRPFRIASVPDMVPGARGFFLQAMRELKWEEGRDFVLLASGTESIAAVGEEVARRVVESRPDLIITWFVAWHIQRFTSSIPIVMMTSGYPVESDVAYSLAHPGKNVTGNTIFAGTGIFAKFAELLRDVKPGIRRIAALVEYTTPLPAADTATLPFDQALAVIQSRSFTLVLQEFKRAENVLRVKIPLIDMRGSTAAQVLEALEAARPDALLFLSRSFWPMREQLMEFVLKRRLPSIDAFPWMSSPKQEHQPLLFYSPDPLDICHTAAPYIVRILKGGAEPGYLPIQRPTRFRLIANMKMAKDIGLTLPDAMLLRVDDIIE